jgi:hypothetical protein
MKGVICSINPDVSVTDITHDITPGDIRAGAFALRNSFSFFPKNTIFICVVDPGVGGLRVPVAVKTKDYIFVAPVEEHQQDLSRPGHLCPRGRIPFHGRFVFFHRRGHENNGEPALAGRRG